MARRVIAQTRIGDTEVLTVVSGITGYRTLVTRSRGDEYGRSYGSLAEAERGHYAIVGALRSRVRRR